MLQFGSGIDNRNDAPASEDHRSQLSVRFLPLDNGSIPRMQL